MKHKSFAENITNIFEGKNKASLSLLLEEDPKEDFGDEEMDEPESVETSEETTPADDGDAAGDASMDEPRESDDSSDDSSDDGVSKEQISVDLENVADNLKNMMSFYDKFGSGGDNSGSLGLHDIQDFISSYITESVSKSKKSYSLKNKNSIAYFLNEETSVDDVEKDIDAVNNIIDKGSTLIDKFKKGSDLNIGRYVDAAINAFKNFDSLFAKESIIKQAVINLIVLNSGANAETNIKDFEEIFHEELHKQFGIEYEEHALITKSQNVAVGAVKQG